MIAMLLRRWRMKEKTNDVARNNGDAGHHNICSVEGKYNERLHTVLNHYQISNRKNYECNII